MRNKPDIPSKIILTGGNILLLDFFSFHVVKVNIPRLALLPILSSL